MIAITFYTTAGCHLCEQAQDLLQQCQAWPLTVSAIDIALNNDLVEQYGTRIPVLKFTDQTELNWPFDLKMLESKLNEVTAN